MTCFEKRPLHLLDAVKAYDRLMEVQEIDYSYEFDPDPRDELAVLIRPECGSDWHERFPEVLLLNSSGYGYRPNFVEAFDCCNEEPAMYEYFSQGLYDRNETGWLPLCVQCADDRIEEVDVAWDFR